MAAVIFCRGLFYFVSSFLLTRLDSCPKKTVYGIKIIMRHGVTGMAQYADFEKLCCDIAVMSKREVKNRLLHFPGRLKLDGSARIFSLFCFSPCSGLWLSRV